MFGAPNELIAFVQSASIVPTFVDIAESTQNGDCRAQLDVTRADGFEHASNEYFRLFDVQAASSETSLASRHSLTG